MWTLKSLTVSEKDAETIVHKWFENQTDAVQTAFLARMKFLVGLPGNGWDRPYVGQLHGQCKGLFEIILEADNVQHRPIGYFSAKEEFTFLLFATEKDDEFRPKNTCKLAQLAKQIASTCEERVREINIEC